MQNALNHLSEQSFQNVEQQNGSHLKASLLKHFVRLHRPVHVGGAHHGKAEACHCIALRNQQAPGPPGAAAEVAPATPSELLRHAYVLSVQFGQGYTLERPG